MDKISKFFVLLSLCIVFMSANVLNGFAASTQGANFSNFIYYDMVEYSISYYLDGGQNNFSNPIFYKPSTPTILLQAPTKLDHIFMGWYGNSSFDGEPITQIAKGSSGNILLYAKWEHDFTQELTFNPTYNGTGYTVSDAALPQDITKVVIPSTYNGIPVTELEAAGFRDNPYIESVTIENGPTAMGNHVFRDAYNLSLIELPASLPEIPVHAFNGCNSLGTLIVNRSVVLHGSITLGATQMLSNTPPNLKIYVPDDSITQYKTSPNWLAYANRILPKSMIYSDYAVISVAGGYSILQYVGTAENISIPTILNGQSVVKIEEDAFRLNKIVKKVLINNYIQTVGANAFNGASNLIMLGAAREQAVGITTAGANFLLGTNPSLSILVSPESVAAYRAAANWSVHAAKIQAPPVHASGFVFEAIEGGLSLLKYVGADQYVVIPSYINSVPVIKLGGFLFSAAANDILSIFIPATVMIIDKVAFNYNAKLESIIVESSNNYYSSSNGVLFNKNKTKLFIYPEGKTDESYIIPSSVTVLEEYSFFNVQHLKNVTIPTSVTEILYRSFSGMRLVQEISLPSSVVSLGEAVFANSLKLKRLYINRPSASSITTTGIGVVSNTHPGLKIYTESTSLEAYKTASNWLVAAASMHSQSIIFGNYAVVDYGSGVQVLQYVGSETHVHMPQQINSKNAIKIADYAFADNETFKHVELPATVQEIGSFAFANCKTNVYVQLNTTTQAVAFGSDALTGQHTSFRLYVPAAYLSAYQEQLNLAEHNAKIVSDATVFGEYSIIAVDGGVSILQYLGHSPTVSIPSTINGQPVVAIEPFAFWKQNVIEQLTLPSTLISIGERAFEGCTQLTSLTIPSSVQSIASGAFYHCESLSTLIVQRDNSISITQAGNEFLHGTHESIIIYVPQNSLQSYSQASNWSYYSSIIQAY